MTDTIYAPATAAGRAAVAVVRISGPGTQAALRAVAGGVPKVRHASLKTLRSTDGAPMDRALHTFCAASLAIGLQFRLLGMRRVNRRCIFMIT